MKEKEKWGGNARDGRDGREVSSQGSPLPAVDLVSPQQHPSHKIEKIPPTWRGRLEIQLEDRMR